MAASATRERHRDPERRVEAERSPPASSHRRGSRTRVGPATPAASGHDVGRCVVQPPVPAPRPQRATAVSAPGDASEAYADAVAARVLRGGPPVPPPGLAAFAVGRVVGGASPGCGPFAAGLPPAVHQVLADPHGGTPIPPAVRQRVEPHVGADLGAVRVLTGPHASIAAASLGARAFTAGSTIVLGRGESASDTRLMAHEATHVAQQAGAADRHGVHRATIMRDLTDLLPDLPDVSVTDLLPQAVLDAVTGAVRSIPGYVLLTQVIGIDPLTGAPVEADRQAMIDDLLSYGPFGAGVGQVLQAMDALGDVVTIVTDTLGQYRLTTARLQEDVDSAWAQFSIANGVEGNVAIVRRVVEGLLADVVRFVTDLAERILAIVRDAVLDLVESLLTGDPTIAPIWSLATKVFHYDPLRGVPVEAETVDILVDFLHLLGQDAALDQMRERGTLQETADWLDTQLATFLGLLEQATALFTDALAAIQPENLGTLLETIPTLAQREFALLVGVGAFAGTVLLKVLELVKHSLLGMLSDYAYAIPGFGLVSVIIGHNPFTGEEVPLTAENLIGGFITLMPGGEATYQQLAETGVIGEAAARIESAMATLGITSDLITSTFLGLWDTLSLADLLAPIDAFQRVVGLFGEPIVRIFEFITVVVQVVIELVLRLMNFPSDLLASILTQTVQAITDIQADPVGFLLRIVEALKAGFQGFFDNALGYLMQGLVAWLFRGLAQLGITIPTEISFASILGLVLEVLGLSMDFIWQKLAEHLDENQVAMIRDNLARLGEAWAFIQDVQDRGIVAIWEYVVDQLSTLWSTILSMAAEWALTTIIVNGTIKLLTFLDPTFIMSVVNGCIAFFEAVRSTLEYLHDMLVILNTFVSTFAAVARGDITPGAQMVERGLGESVPVAIGFLAAQLGLGNVPDRIAEIIRSIRDVVEAAIDWLIEQALRLGAAALNALGMGGGAGAPQGPGEPGEGDADKQESLDNGVAAAQQLLGQRVGGADSIIVDTKAFATGLAEIQRQFGLSILELVSSQDGIAIHAKVNPETTVPSAAAIHILDVVAVRQECHIADVQYEIARQAHNELHQFLQAKGTKSAERMISGICFASGNGEPRHHGAGNKRLARREADAAWRYAEAQDIRWQATGEAQKRAYELLPEIPEEVRGKPSDPLIRIQSDADFMRVLREQFSDVAYFPTGHFADAAAGGPGASAATHAEKLVRRLDKSTAIGVSLPQCGDCQRWFQQVAADDNVVLVVRGPDVTRIFLPNRQILSPSDLESEGP
jgi:Domain of unknown function (DUF4157)